MAPAPPVVGCPQSGWPSFSPSSSGLRWRLVRFKFSRMVRPVSPDPGLCGFGRSWSEPDTNQQYKKAAVGATATRMQLLDLAKWRHILSSARTIAVVGLSPKVQRPSNEVARYLLAQGYRVLPVNPGHERILGLPCYPDLFAAARSLTPNRDNPVRPVRPIRIDIVNVFRRSDQVLPVVEAAIAVGAGAVWLQEGVHHQAAASLAVAAGLDVVEDLCLKTVHAQLFGGGGAR